MDILQSLCLSQARHLYLFPIVPSGRNMMRPSEQYFRGRGLLYLSWLSQFKMNISITILFGLRSIPIPIAYESRIEGEAPAIPYGYIIFKMKKVEPMVYHQQHGLQELRRNNAISSIRCEASEAAPRRDQIMPNRYAHRKLRMNSQEGSRTARVLHLPHRLPTFMPAAASHSPPMHFNILLTGEYPIGTSGIDLNGNIMITLPSPSVRKTFQG